jgi:phenylacetate-CoA ligase
MISDNTDIVWPPIVHDYNATLVALVAYLKESERFPIKMIRAAQSAQLKKLIAHHYKNTPVFAERITAAGLQPEDIRGVTDLEKLPPIYKRDIQTSQSRFCCEQIPNSHKPIGEVKTSGSTGEPIAVMRTAVNQLMWEAMAIRDHQWNARKYDCRLAAIRANIFEDIVQPAWGPPVSRLYPTGPSLGMNVSSDIDHIMEKLREFDPHFLVIHAGVLLEMVMTWEKTGFDLPNLRHVKNLGCMIPEGLRARLKALCGLEIEDNYSSSEVGGIAIQCREGGLLHILEETVYVEILREDGSPCTVGETGRVVVTDLHNFAAPMIRYDLGDYAEVGPARCRCGRTLTTITSVVGRDRNTFWRPDGSRFWPKAGMYELPKIVPIRQWQIIQHELNHIEYKLVLDEPITDEQVEKIKQMAPRFLGYSPKITVTAQTMALPRSKNGKFEEAICLVKT